MSDQDGRYSSGMPFSNRWARQGPSHQTTSRGHVRVDLLPARSHKVGVLSLLLLIVSAAASWPLCTRSPGVCAHRAREMPMTRLTATTEVPSLVQLCQQSQEQVSVAIDVLVVDHWFDSSGMNVAV